MNNKHHLYEVVFNLGDNICGDYANTYGNRENSFKDRKGYIFYSTNNDLRKGDIVIVDCVNGLQLGTIRQNKFLYTTDKSKYKPIVTKVDISVYRGIARQNYIKQQEENLERAKQQKILELEYKLYLANKEIHQIQNEIKQISKK